MRELNLLDYLIILFGTINLVRMGIFLIGSDIYSLKRHQNKRKVYNDSYLPKVSVVIPAHNEQGTILRAIRSVIKSSYPQNLIEILVVDDGSTDDTFKIVSAFIQEFNYKNLKIFSQSNMGKAHALNAGIKNYVSGELVMCLDSDSMIAPNAIENAVSYFRDKKVKALAANVKIIKKSSILNLVQQVEYIVCYQMKRAEALFNIEYIVGGIASTFRREALEKVNFYDTNTVTEDIDLTMKLIKQGNKDNIVTYGDDVIAYTESCHTVSALINQRYRWKWGRCQTFYKNLQMFFNSEKKHTKLLTYFFLPFAVYGDIAFLFEPILVIYILVVTFYYKDLFTLISACTVLSIYFAINILAEDSIKLKERVKLVIFSPIMYFLFFILSFVEYVALIKSLIKIHKIPQSLLDEICRWQHVDRGVQRNVEKWSFLNQLSFFINPYVSVVAFMFVLCLAIFAMAPKTDVRKINSPSSILVASQKLTNASPSKYESTSQTYIVKEGESLWTISKKFFGNGKMWDKIVTKNGSKLIHPGEEVVIPFRSNI